MSSIWEQLDIEPTTDQKKIKKAYANQVKECHQEDDPERWQQLHASYKAALRYAKSAALSQQKPREQGESESHQQRPKERGESENHQQRPKEQRESESHQQRPREQRESESHQQRPREQREPQNNQQRPVQSNQKPEKYYQGSDDSRQQERQKQSTDSRRIRQREESGKPESTYESLFQNIQNGGGEQVHWQKQKGQLEEKMQSLLLLKGKEQAEGFCGFLESYQVSQLYFSVEFWRSFFLFMQRNTFKKNIHRTVLQELDLIQESIYIQAEPELLKMIKQIQTYCREILQKKSQNGALAGVLFVCCGIFCMMLVTGIIRKQNSTMSGEGVQEFFAAYLNEKYETDIYQAEQFEYKKIETYVWNNGKNEKKTAGYFITRKEDDAFRGYVIFGHDTDSEEKRICFDNVEISELEEALAAEFRKMTGVDTSMAFLGPADGGSTGHCIQNDDVVYHTKYEGDISAFLAEEKSVRTKAFSAYNGMSLYAMYTDNINGTIHFYYPDTQTKTLRDRLVLKQGGMKENWVRQLDAFESNGRLEVFAMGIPEDYYRLVFDGKSEEEQKVTAERLRGRREITNYDFPINCFFATEGYWKTYNVITFSPNKEDTWYHIRNAARVAEGVYAIRKTDHFGQDGDGTPVCAAAEVELPKRQIILTAEGDDLTEYIFILDKEELGIGDSYEIVKENGNVFSQKSYERLEMQYTKDLIIDCGDLLVIEPYFDLSEDGKLTFCW